MDRSAHTIIEDDGDINAVMAASLAKAGYSAPGVLGKRGPTAAEGGNGGQPAAFDLVIRPHAARSVREDLVRRSAAATRRHRRLARPAAR
ncbi:MAG: hypothetical protein ACLSVD_06110 [Eggerthellaceae bacterium]